MTYQQTGLKTVKHSAPYLHLYNNELENNILQTFGTKLDNFSVLTWAKYLFNWTVKSTVLRQSFANHGLENGI